MGSFYVSARCRYDGTSICTGLLKTAFVCNINVPTIVARYAGYVPSCAWLVKEMKDIYRG